MTPTPPSASATAASPIADLSYRGYDGTLHTRSMRWWVVALATIRLNMKKKGLWVLLALCALPWLFSGIMLYTFSRMPPGVSDGMMSGEAGQRFAKTFWQAIQGQQFFLFLMALTVGSSSIAADNQANALLVYLSKPLTKGDYLLGKWMGIFLLLFAAGLTPALILYLYCLFGFSSQGFLKDEPLLIVRIVAACAVPGAIHASLLLGFSAWSKTARMAGAVYAAVYFISQIVVGILWGVRYGGRLNEGVLVRHLSIDGVINGLVQNVFHITEISRQMARRTGQSMGLEMPPPPWAAMLLIALVLMAVGILAARAKVRAVEVVRG